MTRRIPMKSYFDCVIIGAGVSGMTAAIYLKRFNQNIVLLEKMGYGGQINQTLKIENYPGFSSIDGPTLAQNIYQQIQNLKIPYHYGNVLEIKFENTLFKVITDMEEIECKSIILATGRTPRQLGIEKEQDLIGRGISYCATCDGMLYKDKEVAIIGGGNSALEEAIYLSSICKKVKLIHRREELRADLILQDKLNKIENIEIILNSHIKSLQEKDGKLNSIIIENQSKEQKELKIEGLFIYIGFIPDTKYIEKLGIQTDNQYIIVDENMKTNIKGIFACGDVIQKQVYQIVTATAEGSIAAHSVHTYLENE